LLRVEYKEFEVAVKKINTDTFMLRNMSHFKNSMTTHTHPQQLGKRR
jgi:hypothetical protein